MTVVAATRRAPAGARAVQALRAVAGTIALGGLLYAGGVIAVAGASRRSSLLAPDDFGVLHNPLGATALRAGVHLDHARFAALLAVMLGCYLVVLGCATALRAAPALTAVVALTGALAAAGPLLSTDAQAYLGYARLGWVHGIDPYLHGPAAALADPVFPYLHWVHTPTVYGPLFTAASLPLGALPLAAGLWTLQGVGAAAALATVACVWAAARRLGRPALPAALFVGLNPLVLVFAVGGAHNDLLVGALTALAVLLAVAGRPGWGAAGAVAAGAVKLTGGLLAPFLLLGEPRRRTLAGLVAALAVAAAGTLLLFGAAPVRSPSIVQAHQGLTPMQNVVGYLGHLAGLGGLTARARHVLEALLGAAVVVLLIRTWRGRPWIDQAGWAALAVLAAAGYLWPWYLAWALPLAALARSRALRAAALLLTGLLVAMQAFPPALPVTH